MTTDQTTLKRDDISADTAARLAELRNVREILLPNAEDARVCSELTAIEQQIARIEAER